jgi:TonB family protein
VVAYFKPAQPSSIRQAFQKVFTGHSAGDGFVAASPVEQPLPSLPPDAVPLEEGASVEMQAKVDRLGNVVNVKVVEGNRQLADASADALFRWRFDPARRNGAPVESAMRIRFEFRNPSR